MEKKEKCIVITPTSANKVQEWFNKLVSIKCNICIKDFKTFDPHFAENLKRIDGNLTFVNCKLGWPCKNLEKVCGKLEVENSDICGLQSLQSTDTLKLVNSCIYHLPNLKNIKENISLKNSDICNMPNLKKIENNIFLFNSKVTNANNVEEVGGQIFISEPRKDKINGLHFVKKFFSKILYAPIMKKNDSEK